MELSAAKPKIIVLCGPTAVGKTSAAVQAALACNGEIINADSMQVYRYMNIGTAKPTATERKRVPHHLIDVVDPDETFDAAKFAASARSIITRLTNEGKTAFVVGGTGLYIKALIQGLFAPGSSDPAVRKQLKRELACHGPAYLYQMLAAVDAETAEKIHQNDTHRLIRALEVFRLTGHPISVLKQAHEFKDHPYNSLKIGLTTDRQTLYHRIDSRVDAMIRAGFVEEVRTLLEKGYDSRLKSMQSIGYRHMAAYLEDRLSYEEAVRTMKRDTRRYAKRQFTWFNKDASIRWMNCEYIEDIIQHITSFLSVQKVSRCLQDRFSTS
ncbi:MAG: tRNA (adenosine(37)-N6)-dimethylallyltransferase MiaA [Desulfobacterales bacterium]